MRATVTSHVPNPLAFAMEEFNVAINTHGDFTYVRFGRDLDRLRVVPSGTPIDVVNALRVALTPHERKTCKEDG